MARSLCKVPSDLAHLHRTDHCKGNGRGDSRSTRVQRKLQALPLATGNARAVAQSLIQSVIACRNMSLLTWHTSVAKRLVQATVRRPSAYRLSLTV